MNSSAAIKAPLTTTQWLICILASIGFAFDIYELLMLPLIIKPALAALGGVGADGIPLLIPGKPGYAQSARLLFFVPALFGGVFGLLGGYLTDRLGRRRVLTASIILYAGAACGAGYATSLTQLLVFRCLVFIGVCVEFVAAVAWLAELFPDALRREKVLGYTQAFSSLGGILVALANQRAIAWSASLPAIHDNHEAWRYTLISGLLPAIPLILIRPFLPESPEWQRKKDAGQLKRPSLAELFSPELCRTTIVTMLLFAASYGVAFGAIQHLPQILPGHADIKQVAKAAQDKLVEEAKAAGKPVPAPRALAQAAAKANEENVAGVQLWQEIGGLAGRFILAVLAVQIVSRRVLLRVFQIPSLLFIPLLFWLLSQNLGTTGSLELFKYGIFFAGLLTVGQFSFWGNYLPLVYPTHLRGTGESFAANIGGRILGTSAAWITITLSESVPPNPGKFAAMGACVAGAFLVMGVLVTPWLPEPKRGALSEE
ncbi:MAG: MFS transporter [Verrucomicrobia bacterium]|nr:MFS transporter [Verrucomicrobiota bacterium]MBI3869771.1 MFS transporter [Verrucomicrobiota bacterium]